MNTHNKPLKMYNLNVNVATNLGAGGLFECNTPRTPEILNSLVAMGNPFDALAKIGQENTSPTTDTSRLVAASPIGSQSMSPPSIQHTCSQLIKEGLKLTLQSKRKISVSDSKDDDEDEPQVKRQKNDELTTEDEERRKRRRERNKIAATKCRMKKREKTANLITESEVLENQNVEMKTQIKDLERQRRSLEDMLNQHVCVRRQQSQHQHAIAAEVAPSTFESFQQPVDSFIDPDFGDDPALISYNKDPNFGKFMDSFFPQVSARVVRSKAESELRVAGTSFSYCDEDADSYRPNGLLDNFFAHNDSGYSSTSNFNSTSNSDPACRA